MPITQAQKQAAAHKNGHALVLAGPGTGKTTTLVERCRLLLRHGVPLDAIFMTTFTQKSASEARDRLRKTLVAQASGAVDHDEVLKGAHIGTFHSLCARILKRYPTDAGLPYDFEIISDDDQRQMLYAMGIEWDEEEGNYVDLISRWKDSGSTPDDAMREAQQLGDKFTTGAAKAYEKYENARLAEAKVDFSDMITLATKVLTSGGEGAKWFHGKFTHFIVDEFQDTNKTQIEFLQAALGKYGQLWAVADENQSLYEWRGSSPYYCLNFSKIFKGAKIYHLSESFRCSPLIIGMASKLISRNASRYDKTMRPARKATPGEFVLYKGFVDAEAEAAWVAQRLKKLVDGGADLRKTAILFRTAGISTFIQRHLEKVGVPFTLVGAGSFWTLPEVSLFVTSVAAVVGDERFDTKTGFGKTKAGFKCRSFAEELKGEPLGVIANPLARVLWEYRPRNLDPERSGAWMTAVEAVLNMLLEKNDIKAFLDHAYQKLHEGQEAKGNRVFLSTLHSAKGLEWDVVFLVGAEDDMLPHFRNNNLEEERRIFYVGMTRARHQLLVSYARRRHDKAKKPSRFLRESVLPNGAKSGQFKWTDPEMESAEKPAVKQSAKAPKVCSSTGRKVYRRGGGKSLIPPEEQY